MPNPYPVDTSNMMPISGNGPSSGISPDTLMSFLNPGGLQQTAAPADPNAAPQAQQPNYGAAYDELQTIAKKNQSMIESLYASLQPMDDTIKDLSGKAGTGTSVDREKSDELKAQADAIKKELERMKGVKIPDAPVYSLPNYPALNLPNAPVPQQAKPNPVAQLLAAVAGFVRPSGANQFNAAALQGAITGTQQQNAQAEQQFKNNVQIVEAKHADDIQRENARIKVDQLNKEGQYEHDINAFHETMAESAKQTDEDVAEGRSKALGKFADENEPAEKAKQQLSLLLPQRENTLKSIDALQRQLQLTISHAATIEEHSQAAQARADAAKATSDERAKHDRALEQESVDKLAEHKREANQSNQTRRDIEAGREKTSRAIAEMRRSAASRVGKAGMIHLNNDPAVTIAKKDLDRADLDVRRTERAYDSTSINDMAADPDKTNRAANLKTAQDAYAQAEQRYTDAFNTAFHYELSKKPGGGRPAGIPSTFVETSPGVWMPPPGSEVMKFDKNGNPVH